MIRKQPVAAAVRRVLVMSAVTTAGFAAPALAQESLDEIVVTGSRIRSGEPRVHDPGHAGHRGGRRDAGRHAASKTS